MNKYKFSPLVSGNEVIRHSFRQSLPTEIVQIARDQHNLEVAAQAKEKWLGEDASLFLLSFLAFFTAFYTFIF